MEGENLYQGEGREDCRPAAGACVMGDKTLTTGQRISKIGARPGHVQGPGMCKAQGRPGQGVQHRPASPSTGRPTTSSSRLHHPPICPCPEHLPASAPAVICPSLDSPFPLVRLDPSWHRHATSTSANIEACPCVCRTPAPKAQVLRRQSGAAAAALVSRPRRGTVWPCRHSLASHRHGCSRLGGHVMERPPFRGANLFLASPGPLTRAGQCCAMAVQLLALLSPLLHGAHLCRLATQSVLRRAWGPDSIRRLQHPVADSNLNSNLQIAPLGIRRAFVHRIGRSAGQCLQNGPPTARCCGGAD